MATATAPSTDLLPEVKKFLATAPLKGVIGGKDVAGSDGKTMATLDPGTGAPIAEFCVLSAADVDQAIHAAARAFKTSGWATMAPNERGVHLQRLADAIEKHKPIIAQIESLDAGKILGQAAGDVQNFVDTLRYFTDMAQHVQRRNVLAVAGHEAWTIRHPGSLRLHLPLEFSFPADRLGHLPGARRRQHGGDQAGRGHADVGDLSGTAGP
jgi:Aldehyde dehydrogenase family